MSIPWLPREVSYRLHDRPHELVNVKTTYLLSTAAVAGFLSREDGKRPSWFNRARLMPVSALTPDLQEHLANACHVICMKVRHEVTNEPAAKGPVPPGKPATTWQAGLLCARVLFRALFAAAAAKAPASKKAVPALFMCSCEGLKQASQTLLTKVWREVQVQFTSKENKYRNMKSRPPWSFLEAHQYEVFAKACGFGVCDPSLVAPSSAGTKPASNLQDYLEEVLALRFAVDWLSASMEDAQEFLDQATKRAYKRPVLKAKAAPDPVSQQLAALKEKSVDSFAMMWTDDAELRGVASLAIRLMDGLEGPSAMLFAATFTGQMLLAMWTGVAPMLSHHAAMGIARIAESHAAMGLLPPPQLPEPDASTSRTAVFDRIAISYDRPSKDCEELVGALPRGVLGAIIKVQATFRGYVFRARYFSKTRAVAAYCKAVAWPELHPSLEGEAVEAPSDKDKKKKKQKTGMASTKVDAQALNQTIADFQPNVSKYLGGEPNKQAGSTMQAPASPSGRMGGTMGSTMGSTKGSMGATGGPPERNRAWPLPTADHRACADLFALYMYNLYRRKELTNMWSTLCGAYERGMDSYAELLNRNPALKPMLESIAAQLKRGSVVGYDKAFIAKHKKEDQSGSTRVKPVDADIFKKKQPDRSKMGETGQDFAAEDPMRGAAMSAGANSTMGMSMSGVKLTIGEEKKGTEYEITGEYLTNYLKEMDGDDSQFKDINPSVVPLSTGTSPQRLQPAESILRTEELSSKQNSPAGSRGGSGTATPTRSRPKLDVPFCLTKCKPIWLPIKAHRFAAYRAKVLQLLPQRVLQQYIDFEKQGQYAACIKLLESATPGSLNVLSPATMVTGKPLLVETVLQLIVGYSGLCLKNQQGSVAVKLITQVLDNMSLSLRDLHPGHRTVLEAYLFDTALSVCYYMPTDVTLSDRSESFFQQASERYLRLGHINRYCKCCLRAAAVLQNQGNKSEAEYYTQQALNKLSDAPVSSLLAICYHNLAVHTIVQHRVADSVAHVRSYVALLRQLPKLGNSWMQLLDNTQWLILKSQELWPTFQHQSGIRDTQVVDGVSRK
eukprot:TRINITY_DN29049_c0_g1_i1.p1 TRINITY_DN29049_c0_g1~~TRINITY_DN29049_c0_g1_i1.p1  ORF type:complete len:1092 (+),score=220.44 TRINITY_DN29049_c0_g1_i1:77-3277(+)